MARIVKKPEERRADILKAARHLFQTKEYDKATMQDVMDNLGIAKGTIYHYFKSKEDLLEAVIEDIVDQNVEKSKILIKKLKGNATQKIQKLIEASNMAEDHPELLDHLHKRGNEAMHTRILAATLMKQAPLFAKLIQKGCDEGIFKSGYPI